MRSIIILTALLLFPVLFPAVGSADIINVPAEEPTIREAIKKAAWHGDTIVVAPGTYVENLSYLGKAITIISSDGPEVTVIDGGSPGSPDYKSVVCFKAGEGPDSVISGFTLTNGAGTYISVLDSFCGGAILSSNESKPTIENNIIIGNDCDFGGGLCCWEADAIVKNNQLISNTSETGGGIYCGVSTDTVISNNLFFDNTGYSNGGGISCQVYSTPVITNNTLLNNSATFGGGLFSYSYSDPTVSNCIFWDGYGIYGNEIAVGANGSFPTSVTIQSSDVEGGQAAVFVDTGCTLNWGIGMIDANPQFVDLSNYDFHLTYTSPCRNSGYNSAVIDSADFEGDPRIANGNVDMGADEFHTHLYITGYPSPGGYVYGKLVGMPGTSPVYMIIGFGVFNPPKQTIYGDLYITAPRILIPLIPIPSNGVLAIPTTLPSTPPAPYDIPMQGLIGLNSDSLTNLCMLMVR